MRDQVCAVCEAPRQGLSDSVDENGISPLRSPAGVVVITSNKATAAKKKKKKEEKDNTTIAKASKTARKATKNETAKLSSQENRSSQRLNDQQTINDHQNDASDSPLHFQDDNNYNRDNNSNQSNNNQNQSHNNNMNSQKYNNHQSEAEEEDEDGNVMIPQSIISEEPFPFAQPDAKLLTQPSQAFEEEDEEAEEYQFTR